GGVPASTWPAFRSAIEARREAGPFAEPGGASQLKRRMIERVLTGCERAEIGEIEPLLTLLRRFATEAAREEARRDCEDLVAEGADAFANVHHRRAAEERLGARFRSPRRARAASAADVRCLCLLARDEFLAPLAQPAGQLRGERLGMRAAVLADDGAYRIDVLVDEVERNARRIVRLLDEPA